MEGEGFYSEQYVIEVNNRPDLIAMNISIESPAYTGGERKIITNTGDITTLEGSSVLWEISTLSTDSIKFFIDNKQMGSSRISENSFGIDERVFESGEYSIRLFNPYGKNSSERSM